MDRITVVQDLSSVWFKAVKDGKIINEFEANDDQQERWKKGQLIRFGLIFDNGTLKYFARNITTSTDIQASVDEKVIENSNFIVQFNGFRALKPGGKIPNIGRQKDVPAEASNCRFYCQDPKGSLSILRRDPLIQVALPNWKWNAYYNAMPFEEEGHFLWLPVSVDGTTTIIPHIPQELSHALLEDALVLFRNSDKLAIFFNSLHAGASVNHIHLQAVFHKGTLSIETASIVEREGLAVLYDYPAHGIVFNRDAESDKIWPYLDRLQEKKVPFNLIFVGERICLIPRNPEHEVVEEFPMGVIASMELAGKIITVDKEAVYDNINYTTIQTAFQKTTVLDF
jgi:hypothetical protein